MSLSANAIIAIIALLVTCVPILAMLCKYGKRRRGNNRSIVSAPRTSYVELTQSPQHRTMNTMQDTSLESGICTQDNRADHSDLHTANLVYQVGLQSPHNHRVSTLHTESSLTASSYGQDDFYSGLHTASFLPRKPCVELSRTQHSSIIHRQLSLEAGLGPIHTRTASIPSTPLVELSHAQTQQHRHASAHHTISSLKVGIHARDMGTSHCQCLH